MIPLASLKTAEKTVLDEARKLLSAVRRHAATEPASVAEAIGVLAALRKEVYEDLNQLQHEYLIIKSASWLLANGLVPTGISWSWNPRQTGDNTEPDLAAELNGQTLVSAEVTASTEPKGKIDERMALTLVKLSRMPGQRFYFVCAEAMRHRAETKIRKGAWSIRAVYLANIGQSPGHRSTAEK